MRRLLLAFFATTLAFSVLAHADDWNKTFNISGKPDLRVETSDANLTVDTWDRNTIEAHVTTEGYKIGEGGIRVIDHQNGDSIGLEVRYPHHDVHFGFRHSRVDVVIHMPREGRVNLRTADGKIELRGLKGEMDIYSGDGSQNIESVDGSLRARTGDGRIQASGRFDLLDLNTGDGRIDATAQPNSAVSHEWMLRTGDGSVALHVPEKLAADVDLHTNDGHISTDVPLTLSGRIGDHNVRGKLNGGGNLLTVHTGDGSITLQKT